MLINDMTDTRPIWVLWHPFKHHGRCAVGKRPIYHIGVTGDPAHIGGFLKYVIVFDIKHITEGG